MTKIRILTTLIFTLTLFAVSCQTTSAQTLPAKVKIHLDKSYSGWEYSTLSELCSSYPSESKISSDFDGNRKIDYVVKIKHGRKGYIIAFLSSGTNYKPVILESPSAIDIDGKTMELSDGRTLIINCEVSSYAYIYKNGKFSRKWLSD